MRIASILRRRLLLALLPLVLLLASGVAASAQTVINHLPYTINTKGLYVLNDDLSSTQTSGNLITVNSGNVTIDLQGHYLTGPANYVDGSLYGIYASECANVTVRNGTISHCYFGIFLTGDGNANTTNNLNQVLDTLRVIHGVYGIFLHYAPGSRVTNCQLTQLDYGINIDGPGSTVQGCVVSQIDAGGIVLDAGSFARQNTISSAAYGVLYGLYQDNLASGCTTPFYSGTNGGGNASN